LTALLMMVSGTAAAEGERSPMIGGGVLAARADEGGQVGVGLEATYWWHRIGIAVEGSRRWEVESGDPASTTLTGGLRLLIADQLLGSIIEPRDLELGLEIHGVVEKSWFDVGGDAVSYGGGAALRLRGGGDAFDSTLLAETRLFVRVMAPRERNLSERVVGELMTERTPLSIVVGLGAVWGSGERRYADKFRSRFATPIVFPDGQ
jgi:hypothetical protein